MPDASVSQGVAGASSTELAYEAVPQPLVIRAPVVAHACVEPRIYELRHGRRASTQPQLIYGMPPDCGTLSRVAVIVPPRRGPRVVTIAE